MSDTSVIAANHKVTGTISAAEDLVIVGRVEGRIQSEATVVIEAQAIVEAEVLARHVIVKGIVVGDVSGVEGIEITATGQVLGDLRTRRLALRGGGRVLGNVHTGIDVPAYAMAGKNAGAAAWSRGASRPQQRAFEEVVESSSRASSSGFTPPPASTSGAGEARKAKKEPSREAL